MQENFQKPNSPSLKVLKNLLTICYKKKEKKKRKKGGERWSFHQVRRFTEAKEKEVRRMEEAC